MIERIWDKKLFAVKAFSKNYLNENPKGKALVLKEIIIQRQLDHPNIGKLLEVYESQNSLYLVQELFEGGNLNNYLKVKKALSMKDIQIILKSILEALKHMSE